MPTHYGRSRDAHTHTHTHIHTHTNKLKLKGRGTLMSETSFKPLDKNTKKKPKKN